MGGCVAGERDENEEKEYVRNRGIEDEIKKIRKKDEDKKVKLLLLGTGDSGKSTFAKQMRYIYKEGGFAHLEVQSYKNIIRSNTLNSMQRVFDYGSSKGFTFSKKVEKYIEPILEARDLSDELATAIQNMWEKDEELNKFVNDNMNELQIPSSAIYFFENAGRFGVEDFKPTNDDIFRAKLKTTGINETKFFVNDVEFTMVDVGGQRAERKKWLHCFDGVNCVIYLAALDEYNMMLQEDNNTNRLTESLKLFGEVTCSQWFEGKSFILFLNKSDLFEKKNSNSPSI